MRTSLTVVYLFIFLILVGSGNMSFAGITFTDGKWETTFDCAEQSQADGTWPDCNDVELGGNWTFYIASLTDGSSNNWTQSTTSNEWYYTGSAFDGANSTKTVIIDTVIQKKVALGSLSAGKYAWGDKDSLGYSTVYVYQTADPDAQAADYIYANGTHGKYVSGDYASSITSSANNPSGSGEGFRKIDGDGGNIYTGPLAVAFPSAQKELWIRWYQRHEDDYVWKTISKGDVPLYDKHVYLATDTQNTAAIAEYHYDTYAIIAQNTPDYYQVTTEAGEGWTGIMNGDESDGLFHCFEIHIKMDTDGTDGIGQIWIDGVLKASEIDVNWSGVDRNTPEEIATAQEGWIFFKLGSNQGSPNNGTSMYVDHDDLSVYNSTPPNKDLQGNPFIGPIWSPRDFKNEN